MSDRQLRSYDDLIDCLLAQINKLGLGINQLG